MTKAEEILRKEITLFEWDKKNEKQLIPYEDALKAVNKSINYTHICETLEVKEEIVFEDWLKQHRFTKDINNYIKNNITYREWEVFNMYTMDVYNL